MHKEPALRTRMQRDFARPAVGPRVELLLLCATAILSACASVTPTRGESVAWSVTVLGDSSDPRFVAVGEATQYWNHQLAAIGAPVRFAPVAASAVPAAVLPIGLHGVLSADRRRTALARPPLVARGRRFAAKVAALTPSGSGAGARGIR